MIFDILRQHTDELENFTERPWGKFAEVHLSYSGDDLVHRQKLLIVEPNTKLTLHHHLNYSELWMGEIAFDYILEDENGELIQLTAEPYERVYIHPERKHTIINTNDEHLHIFEIQTGTIHDSDNIKFE